MLRQEDQSSSPPSSPEERGSKGKGKAQKPEDNGEEDDDIWPEEVEIHFQEALKLYPPIGRRKLLEGGKMYGRNELIAKYIFDKTGKKRTRKQVSSHIQVLGKKTKKMADAVSPHMLQPPYPAPSPFQQMPPFAPPASSSQLQPPYIIAQPPSELFQNGLSVLLRWWYATSQDFPSPSLPHYFLMSAGDFNNTQDVIAIREISDFFFGLESLFRSSPLPCFFCIRCSVTLAGAHGNSEPSLQVRYETKRPMTLKCSTTIYSFGKAVVEKIQVEDGILDGLNQVYTYDFNHSPMCDYMVTFINTLKSLPTQEMMNLVLQNFSVLQVIIDTRTNSCVMTSAIFFEVTPEPLPNRVSRIVP